MVAGFEAARRLFSDIRVGVAVRRSAGMIAVVGDNNSRIGDLASVQTGEVVQRETAQSSIRN